jgi:outer membrane immunogenic protein
MDKIKLGMLVLATVIMEPCYAGAMGPIPSHNWTGVYIGGQIGEAWGYQNLRQETVLGTRLGETSYNNSSFLGGAYAGLNWQINDFVVSIEGDGNGVSLSNYGTCLYQTDGVGNPSPGSCFSPAYNYTIQIPWQAAARGRLGWIWAEQTLFYVAGGVAFTDVKATFTTVDNYFPLGSETFRKTYTGSTAGIGVEFRFNNRWIARAEYRYDNYGNNNHLITQGGAFWDGRVVDTYIKDNSFRVGLSYLII